jgi:hypothetical protein
MAHTEHPPSTATKEASPPRPLTDHPKVAETLAEVLAAHAHALRSTSRMLEDVANHPILLTDISLGEEIAYARRHTNRAADCLDAASEDYRRKAGA